MSIWRPALGFPVDKQLGFCLSFFLSFFSLFHSHSVSAGLACRTDHQPAGFPRIRFIFSNAHCILKKRRKKKENNRNKLFFSFWYTTSADWWQKEWGGRPRGDSQPARSTRPLMCMGPSVLSIICRQSAEPERVMHDPPSSRLMGLSLSLSLLPHKCFYKSISLKTNWISHWPSRRRWIIPVYDVVWLIQSHVFLLQLSSGEGTRQIQKTTRASKNKDVEINRGGWANTSHLRLDDAGGVVRASTVREREMESMPRRPYPVSLLAHFPRENRRSSFSFPISSCPSLHPPNTHTRTRPALSLVPQTVWYRSIKFK